MMIPASYWILTLLWLVILGLYLLKLRESKIVGGTIRVLLILLAIDAFRTLFESIYFGLYFNSMFGLLPYALYDFLSRPSMIIIPKLINIAAAIIVLVLLIRRWIPSELRKQEERVSGLEESEHRLRQSEELLKQEKQQLVEVLWATNAGIWTWDIQTDKHSYSESWADLLGYSLAELPSLSDSWKGLLHPDDIDKAFDLLDQHFSGKLDYFECELRLQHKNGDWIWLLDRGKVVEWSEAGKPLRMSGTLVDISERKEAEQERELLISAIEQAAETIVITNKNGDILYTNPAFEQISGYSKQEALGQNPRILQSGKLDQEYFRAMWETLSSGHSWNGRFINKRKDGTLYTEDARISPIHGISGDITNFVAVKHDISHELELEKQLRQAQKLEVIGTLASGIAHDFNNILTPILGYTQLMREEENRSALDSERLSIILNSAQRAKILIEQVLDFSRKKDELNQVLRLKPQIEETAILLRASIPTTIQLNLELQDLQIFASVARIQQIILNLCTNAAQAMTTSGGKITIKTQPWALAEQNIEGLAPGHYLLLSVQDSGPGIAADVLPHIFDPYFTTKEIGEGSGIGLATVQRNVTALGGRIRVKSQLGQGCCFQILFPLIEGEAPSTNQLMPQQLPHGDKHLLLVDDEEALVNISREFLQDLGYRVSGFTRSTDALRTFEEHPEEFDLLITDLTMPELTGLQLAHRINQINSDLPVILCTGQQELPQKTDLKNIKLLKILHKPDLFTDMAYTLHQHFND